MNITENLSPAGRRRDLTPWPSRMPSHMTQALLNDPTCGIEGPFLDALETHIQERVRSPVHAELNVAGRYYADLLNLFNFLASVKIMDRAYQRLRTNSLVPRLSAVPIYDRSREDQEPSQFSTGYHGAVDSFMRSGQAIAIPAVRELAADVAHGQEQDYQALWDMCADAFWAKRVIRGDYKRTARNARVQLPFNLGIDERDTQSLLEETWSSNITETALGIVISHAVAQTLADQKLPSATDLASSFLAMEDAYDAVSSNNRLVFSQLHVGREVQQQLGKRRLQTASPHILVPPPKGVVAVLDDYISNPHASDSDLFADFSSAGNFLHITSGSLHPSLANGPLDDSDCGGGQPLFPRSQDLESIAGFEKSTGAPLPRPFNSARVLLRLSKELAVRTIYSDPLARAGIQRIAAYVKDHSTKE